MAELIWRETYERAVELFGGQTPGAQLEADLVDRFEQRPTDVVAAVDKLGERFASGRVHSPWPLVLRELNSAPPRGSIRASDLGDRARALHLVERYLAAIAHVLPSEAELLDEVFGARGRLRPWASDSELRARVVETWRRMRAPAPIPWP